MRVTGEAWPNRRSTSSWRGQARAEIAAALAAATSKQRVGALSNAISRVQNARDQIGSNLTFALGAGNLFF